MGYSPKPLKENDLLFKLSLTEAQDNLETLRQKMSSKIKRDQEKQKQRFDKSRKWPRQYNVGDLVWIKKNYPVDGTSRNLKLPYDGPMIVTEVQGSKIREYHHVQSEGNTIR